MKDLKGRISRDLLLNLELHIFDSQALNLYASSWGRFLWKCLRARTLELELSPVTYGQHMILVEFSTSGYVLFWWNSHRKLLSTCFICYLICSILVKSAFPTAEFAAVDIYYKNVSSFLY